MNEKRLLDVLTDAKSISSDKAIRSRMSKARSAEDILGIDLDQVVNDDKAMYQALVKLKNNPREHNSVYQNVVRWYYHACNGHEFPRLIDFKNKH